METVILEHLRLSSRKKFLVLSDIIPSFVFQGNNKLLFDEDTYYLQQKNNGKIFIDEKQEDFFEIPPVLEIGWYEIREVYEKLFVLF